MASDKTTVLIVEDEPAIVELVTFSLREAGWNCCAVQSVAEAWDFIQNRTPQLILLDWMLPDQTGLRLLARIRSDRQFNEIPVSMMTGISLNWRSERIRASKRRPVWSGSIQSSRINCGVRFWMKSQASATLCTAQQFQPASRMEKVTSSTIAGSSSTISTVVLSDAIASVYSGKSSGIGVLLVWRMSRPSTT